MESNNVKRDRNPSLNGQQNYVRAHVMLRLLATVATLVAALCMGFNKQSSDIAGFELKASYKSSPAFKFFVVGNAVACGYSLISMFFIADLVEGYLFHLLDLMIMGLVMASASAATAIAYIGKRGNENIGWIAVCPYYEKFCNRVGISLVCSYLGFVLLLLMCALSFVYKTRRICDL